jgi:hypothetical protein
VVAAAVTSAASCPHAYEKQRSEESCKDDLFPLARYVTSIPITVRPKVGNHSAYSDDESGGKIGRTRDAVGPHCTLNRNSTTARLGHNSRAQTLPRTGVEAPGECVAS